MPQHNLTRTTIINNSFQVQGISLFALALIVLVSSFQAHAGRADDPGLIKSISQGDVNSATSYLKRLPDKEINYPLDSYGNTLLHIAVQSSKNATQPDIIQALIDHGANVNASNNRGQKPIHMLGQRYYKGTSMPITELLVSNGADINSVDMQGNTLLFLMVSQRGMNQETIDKIITFGANVNVKNNKGVTPLMRAIQSGNEVVTRALIDAGANTKITDKDGNTILHMAARSNRMRLIDMALDNGIDISAMNSQGQSALSILVSARKLAQARLLLERGADVNAIIGRKKETVGLHILMHPEYGLSDLIDKSNVKVNLPNKEGSTPLFDTLRFAQLEKTKTLVELGINIHDTGAPNYPPVPLLAEKDPKRYPEALPLLEYMLEKGVNVDAQKMGSGKTGLMIAAERGNIEAMKLMVKYGANVNRKIGGRSRTNFTYTPLGTALKKQRYAAAMYLIEVGALPEHNDIGFWIVIPQIVQDIEKQSDPKDKGALLELYNRLTEGDIAISEKITQKNAFESAWNAIQNSNNDVVRSVAKRIHIVNKEPQKPKPLARKAAPKTPAKGKNLSNSPHLKGPLYVDHSKGKFRPMSPRASREPESEQPYPPLVIENDDYSLCNFDTSKWPDNYIVYAAGGRSKKKLNFQIDQSGRQASLYEIKVNSPDRPVALLLGSYIPTIWNIHWTKGTKILGILATGNQAQRVSGIDPGQNVQVRISSHAENKHCGYGYVSAKTIQKTTSLSKQYFKKDPILIKIGKGDTIVIGEPLNAETALLTNKGNDPRKHYDPKASKAGEAGLRQAVADGLIRPARKEDADRWAREYANIYAADQPRVVGGDPLDQYRPKHLHNAYVILKSFRIPAGLSGANSATFFLGRGVAYPEGNFGHSRMYDFNNITCRGTTCGMH